MTYRIFKRIADLIIAGAALILLAPLMAAAAVAVRVSMGSPVLFRHPRPGLHEEVFECLKFRTMISERDASGALVSEMNRLTPLGRFMRRTSLDELPQLWTVITGKMSLVGPRPLEVRYLQRYTTEQRRRHSVMPGITGWAQINGRNAIDWDRKLGLDLWYVDHCNLALDFKILAITGWKVLTGAGVARAGQVSMDEFWGIQQPAKGSIRNV